MERDERSEWAEQMPEFGPDTQILEGGTSRALLGALLSDDELNGFERDADRAEAGQLAPVDGTALHGEDAARLGRDLLMTATGADTIDEAIRIALGRPADSDDQRDAV